MRSNWKVQEVAWPADVLAAGCALADGRETAWLDTATPALPMCGGCSLICVQPIAVVEQYEGARARLLVHGRTRDDDQSAWALWRRVHRATSGAETLPWSVSPGWIGYIGLEMARQLERLPATRHADQGLPLFRMALFDRGIVLEHGTRRAFAVSAAGLAGAVRGASPVSDEAWLARWAAAAGRNTRSSTVTAGPACFESQTHIRAEMLRASYERMVRRALEYIGAGDIYQVNLAQRLRIEGLGDPWAVYAAVREANPATYGALLTWDGGAVASVSPELFLRLRDRAVLTRPIKGTRPRSGEREGDERRQRDLICSPKEAAELAMIVDLHRNDLGRVCEYGSVNVVDARRVEAHPTVFHTVADIQGRLRAGLDGLDLLAACFPAGSVSGVPKIRALEVIDELEPVARGAYTGAIGSVGLDGQMTVNVAIRTLQIRGQTATLHVGGGIVADSEPVAEYEETLAKARGILRGLGVRPSELEVAGPPPALPTRG